jgi:hypothetical protein
MAEAVYFGGFAGNLRGLVEGSDLQHRKKIPQKRQISRIATLSGFWSSRGSIFSLMVTYGIEHELTDQLD